MVRLKDIAARAGVSMMTVSKALRDASDVSPATRARIRLLAQQLGYVPNAAAQALSTSKTRLLGVLVPSITNPIYPRILVAMEERAHELGYDLLLACTLGTVAREEACLRRLLARRVDGVFISPVHRMTSEAPIYRELQERQVHTVILGQRSDFCRQFANVEGDDLLGSYAVTRHLTHLGHRRIAFLTGPQVAPWAQERFEGYRRALREAQRDVDDKLIFQAGNTIEAGQHAALQMINEASDATAIYACNDLVAIGAGETLLNQGIRIPQDMSLAGYGNYLTSEHFRVPLTTVRQPKYSLGNAAMEVMVNLLRGGPPEIRRLPVEMIIRASTAAPPARAPLLRPES